MTIELKGNWEKGIALGLHTLSSTHVGIDEFGHDRFETVRSKIGELLYKLKYQNNKDVISVIVDHIKDDVRFLDVVDAIIPIPPSNRSRSHQPVFLIGKNLARRTTLPFYQDVLIKTCGEELKSINNPTERMKKLEECMKITSKHDLQDKKVLLIDDLYRSGSTLKAATKLLMGKAHVKEVYVLTITKTRSNR